MTFDISVVSFSPLSWTITQFGLVNVRNDFSRVLSPPGLPFGLLSSSLMDHCANLLKFFNNVTFVFDQA